MSLNSVLLASVISLLSFSASAQTASEVWRTGGFDVPESTYYSPEMDVVIVSNVVGSPLEHDGNGFLSTISRDGQTVNLHWIETLDAPKGMRSKDGILYVADIDHLVKIDIKAGEILDRIAIPDAGILNDVTIDKNGVVYVTDTFTHAIHRVVDDKPEVFLQTEQVSHPNGITVSDDGSTLYVAGWGKGLDNADNPENSDWSTETPGDVYAIDVATKVIKTVNKEDEPVGNLDGIEILEDGTIMVSDWTGGALYTLDTDGNKTTFASGLTGAADIGYDPDTNRLFVPNMGENQVIAYSLPTISVEEEKSNKRVVRQFFDHISANNSGAAFTLVSEDVKWWIPGELPFSGVKGKADYKRDVVDVINSAFKEGLQMNVKSLLADGPWVIAEVESYGKHYTGKIYQNRYHFRVKLKDGKFVEVKEYMNTLHLWRLISQ